MEQTTCSLVHFISTSFLYLCIIFYLFLHLSDKKNDSTFGDKIKSTCIILCTGNSDKIIKRAKSLLKETVFEDNLSGSKDGMPNAHIWCVSPVTRISEVELVREMSPVLSSLQSVHSKKSTPPSNQWRASFSLSEQIIVSHVMQVNHKYTTTIPPRAYICFHSNFYTTTIM